MLSSFAVLKISIFGSFGRSGKKCPGFLSLQATAIFARKFGTSKYGLNRTFKVVSDLLLMLFFKKYMQKPMHLFGNTGVFVFFVGVLINFYLAVLKIGFGQDIWGKPLLILGLMLIIGGIQLITVGIIIEIQMRTYFEAQSKRLDSNQTAMTHKQGSCNSVGPFLDSII